MRGKGGCDFLEQLFYGITPAYAGKRIVLLQKNGDMEDHPRLCGEKHLVKN